MKISCPSCTAKYSIADDKVQNRLAKIRCRKCGTTIVIDGKSDPPVVRAADGGGTDEEPAASTAHGYPSLAPNAQTGAAPAGQGPAAAGSLTGTVYTVDVADNDQRSMTVEQIVAAYNDGTIAADTYVWREGMGDWEPLADVDELNRALHAAAAGAAPQAAAAPAVSLSASSAAATGRVSNAGMFGGSVEAARTASRGEVSRDLFGSIDMAGSEYDTRTASQEAAQAKAATGARNESSVLFSLSALTSGPEPAFRSAPPKNREDSGLIDLAALASLAATNASKDSGGGIVLGDGGGSLTNSPLAAPLGLPPLAIGAAASPLGGLEVPRPANTNRGAMYIGGGIAVAAIVASLAWLLKEDPPAPVAVAPAPVVAAPALPSTPEPEVAAAAGEEGAAKEKEDEKAAEGEGKTGASKATTSGASRPRPSKPRPQSGGSPAPAKPAAEPASGGGEEKKPAAAPKKKCNCSPSDLMCAMRCSAK